MIRLSMATGRSEECHFWTSLRTDEQHQYLLSRELMTSEDAKVSAPVPALLDRSADTGYLSSQTSSMRQPLVMLLTMIVNPFT